MSEWITWILDQLPHLERKTAEAQTVVIREIKEMLPRGGGTFIRIAGISGALAVSLGAYGAHSKYSNEILIVIFI